MRPMCSTGEGVCSSVIGPKPHGVGELGPEWGGGQQFLSILGTFLNSPFHFDHFKYTHLG